MCPYSPPVSQNYTERRGLITGIVMAGVGVGQLIVPPLAAWMISVYDWRFSYIIIGIGALLLMMVSAQFLKYPGGRTADASTAGSGAALAEQSVGEPSVRDAMHTVQLWLIMAIQFCLAYCTMAVMVHIVPYTTALGIAPTVAASILSVIGGALIAGRVAMGAAADKIGEDRIFLIGFVLLAAASIGLLLVRQIAAFYLIAVLFGLALSTSSAIGSTLIARIYGLKRHAALFGMTTFSFTFGASISPYLFGYIHDLNTNYHEAFLTGVAVALLGLIAAVLLVARISGRRKAG